MKRIIGFILLLIILTCIFAVASAEDEIGLITYSQISNYRELYEPDMKQSARFGKYKVKIEVVIGVVIDISEDEYAFTMWVKDDIGYYPYSWDKYDKFPFKPKYGQRIIIELYPTYYVGINDEGIQNCEIVEDNVDVLSIAYEYFKNDIIPYENLSRYKELYQPNMDEWDFLADSSLIYLDTIIGKVYSPYSYRTDYEIWIKGNSGYYRRTFEDLELEFDYKEGQRVIFGACVNYNGSVISLNKYHNVILQEGLDTKILEINGIETDPIRKLFKTPYNESDFSNEYSYKKILRKKAFVYSSVGFKTKITPPSHNADIYINDELVKTIAIEK